MHLEWIDWALIIIYLLVTLGIAIKYSNQAGKNLGEFFLGGRRLPWYIAGISMVATTFAADTPLAVTELVATQGISGNWLWWNFLIGGMLTTFFFSRLWRRANVLTEVEFITLRYSGKAADVLRSFKSVYLGLFINVLVLGWVNTALASLLEVFFDIPTDQVIWYVGAAMLLVAVYSSLSGLMGVAITDLIQFCIAMAGSVILAVIVLNSEQIGGVSGLQTKLGADSPIFNFFPTISASDPGGAMQVFSITFGAFFAYIGVQWWASWYPGAEPGGGGYVAQRMMSAKNEKHAVWATLFFQVAHYCIRPWPWIIVGLCAVALYSLPFTPADPALVEAVLNAQASGLTEQQFLTQTPVIATLAEANEELAQSIHFTFNTRLGYVYAMQQFLPTGLKGLLLVAFLAAYMSTISTQLNWGASYLVNDFYAPVVMGNQPDSQEKQSKLVLAGRVITFVLMAVALYATTLMDSISGVWAFLIECGAGLGMVLIIRWFWWRVNVWSEIAATLAPFFLYALTRYVFPEVPWLADWSTFPNSYFVTVGGTTVIWLLVTYLTAPESNETLHKFYRQVKPGGWWAGFQLESDDQPSFLWPFLCWLSGILMTYSFLFGFGTLIFGKYGPATLWLGTGVLAGIALKIFLDKMDLEEENV